MRRARYRVGQFLRHLRRTPLTQAEQAQVHAILPLALRALFERMTPAEQAHSLRVMQALQAQGHCQAELLQAALLHDVGKVLAPLNVFERTAVVLARKFIPNGSLGWGQGPARGWRRPFVTAAQHPDWGAELCARAGAAPLTVDLVRRHQTLMSAPHSADDELLRALQQADDDN